MKVPIKNKEIYQVVI